MTLTSDICYLLLTLGQPLRACYLLSWAMLWLFAQLLPNVGMTYPIDNLILKTRFQEDRSKKMRGLSDHEYSQGHSTQQVMPSQSLNMGMQEDPARCDQYARLAGVCSSIGGCLAQVHGGLLPSALVGRGVHLE